MKTLEWIARAVAFVLVLAILGFGLGTCSYLWNLGANLAHTHTR